MSDPADIHSLVQRAQAGDGSAVEALYHAYVQKIFRYVVYRVPDDDEAQDITAEVFVKMIEGLGKYRVTGAPFEAWLYRIAAARVADYFRHNRRTPQSELSETFTSSDSLPEDQLQSHQEVAALREAMQGLNADQQTVLILRFVEHKSHEETAAILGKQVNAVRSIQHRALTRLAERLGAVGKMRHYLRGKNE